MEGEKLLLVLYISVAKICTFLSGIETELSFISNSLNDVCLSLWIILRHLSWGSEQLFCVTRNADKYGGVFENNIQAFMKIKSRRVMLVKKSIYRAYIWWILVCLEAFGSNKFNQGNYQKTDVGGKSQDTFQKFTATSGCIFFWKFGDSSKHHNVRTVFNIFSRIAAKFLKLNTC